MSSNFRSENSKMPLRIDFFNAQTGLRFYNDNSDDL